jgi:hypothetical protein
VKYAPIAEKTRFWVCQSKKFGGETETSPLTSFRSSTAITRSASGNGSGRRSTPRIRLKMAVFAPIASASVATAVAVKPGLFERLRTA